MLDYRGCQIIQCFIVQSNMASVSQNKVGLERMLDYRGVGLQRFHCNGQYCYINCGKAKACLGAEFDLTTPGRLPPVWCVYK